MNDYIGKICPYCKTKFTDGDDIVLCSTCDMPHHKDCWIENQGCTTFGCMGTIKTVDGSVTSVTANEIHYEDSPPTNTNAFVFCTKCGSQNSRTSSFCSKCGNRLTASGNTAQSAANYTQANPVNAGTAAYSQYYGNQSGNQTYSQAHTGGYAGQNYQNNTIDPTVTKLIGTTNSNYYIQRFQEMKAQNKQSSWNWVAFLASPFWLIYRKMYTYGFGLLAIAFVLDLIDDSAISWIILYAGYIAIGVFANYIYMNHLEKLAGQANAMNEPFKTQFIEKNGDVNLTATIIAAVVFVVLTFIVSL